MTAVAIIGAGLAGLSCARTLHAAGVPVTVFDKGRSPGGRASTRQGLVPFDHGAQYFTASDPAFADQVDAWRLRGSVDVWNGRIVAIDRPGMFAPVSEKTRYVGVPGMNAIALDLAAPIEVWCGVTVAPVRRDAAGWLLATVDGGTLGHFDTLVVTAPPAQTIALLPDCDLGPVDVATDMAPCLAVMVAWESPIEVPFDAAFVNHGPLSWIARNDSKPGRTPAGSWVLHGSPAWSRAHLETPPADAVAPLLAAFDEACDAEFPPPTQAAAHRWRYALPRQPLDARYLWDAANRLAIAGDWCGGPRIEGAWLSGRAAAERILHER